MNCFFLSNDHVWPLPCSFFKEFMRWDPLPLLSPKYWRATHTEWSPTYNFIIAASSSSYPIRPPSLGPTVQLPHVNAKPNNSPLRHCFCNLKRDRRMERRVERERERWRKAETERQRKRESEKDRDWESGTRTGVERQSEEEHGHY